MIHAKKPNNRDRKWTSASLELQAELQADFWGDNGYIVKLDYNGGCYHVNLLKIIEFYT